MTPKNVLAIGGHIGDAELTAGALLATCAAHGGRAVTLALTAGEKGAPVGADIAEYRRNKIKEAESFAADIGGKAYVLDYPDGLLPDNDEVRFKVAQIIRDEKPDIIVTHHAKSMHKDHEACHRIVVDAWFYAALPGFDLEGDPHYGKLHFAENWEDAEDFKPYVYIDVTDGFPIWEKAIDHHWFVLNSKDFKYKEYYCHLKRMRGIEAHTGYCETFMVQPENVRLVQKLEEI